MSSKMIIIGKSHNRTVISPIMALVIGYFRVPPGLCIKTRLLKCSAFDMEMIFHSHANKTHFHKKGCALGLFLKVRVYGTRKWPLTLDKVWKKHVK